MSHSDTSITTMPPVPPMPSMPASGSSGPSYDQAHIPQIQSIAEDIVITPDSSSTPDDVNPLLQQPMQNLHTYADDTTQRSHRNLSDYVNSRGVMTAADQQNAGNINPAGGAGAGMPQGGQPQGGQPQAQTPSSAGGGGGGHDGDHHGKHHDTSITGKHNSESKDHHDTTTNTNTSTAAGAQHSVNGGGAVDPHADPGVAAAVVDDPATGKPAQSGAHLDTNPPGA